MKMTLKNRISKALELLSDDDFKNFANCMHSNDIVVVFHTSKIFGSELTESDNKTLMNRNAVSISWYSEPSRSSCPINSAYKKAYAQVVDYLDCGYNITPGRVLKLLDILSNIESESLYNRKLEYSYVRKKLTHNDILDRYLRNLNDLRMHYGEMTESEIYDFSFDMVYEFFYEISLSNATLSLAFLIMYWIQRECNLVPLAVPNDKIDELRTVLEPQFVGMLNYEEKKKLKKEFQLFMRKLLDSHLKAFIRNNFKDNVKKVTSRDRILELIKANPKHTAKTMASCLGLSVQGIQKQIATLKKENRIKRIGSDKGGRWKVIEEKQLFSVGNATEDDTSHSKSKTNL